MPSRPPIHRPPGAASKQERQRASDQRRGSSTARGYGYRWQRYRERFLKEHPLCIACEREGKIRLANEVDHIKPHRGNAGLFWDSRNHQSLCKPCHSRKTATEAGGIAGKGGRVKSLKHRR